MHSHRRVVRTRYYFTKLFARTTASVTLEGAVQAAVMRLLRDKTVDSAFIYGSPDDKAQTVSIYRVRNTVNVEWHQRGLFPRPDPRAEAAPPAKLPAALRAPATAH